jgi:hypothetical protein
MKYLLRVVYERFYEVDNKTLTEAKEEVIRRSVDHICSLADMKNHAVFSVEEYVPPNFDTTPARRKHDVAVYPLRKSRGL